MRIEENHEYQYYRDFDDNRGNNQTIDSIQTPIFYPII